MGSNRWPPELIELYRSERLPLVRLAYLTVGDAAAAEELVQDAFVAVGRRWDRVEAPKAYLRRTVVNRCTSWGRRRALEQRTPPEPSDHVELEADEMWDALGRLNTRQRTAVVLRYYEQLPVDDIAVVLGCRPATVRTSIHRALQRLRRELEP